MKKSVKSQRAEEFLNEEFNVVFTEQNLREQEKAVHKLQVDSDIFQWLELEAEAANMSVGAFLNRLLRQVKRGNGLFEARLARLEKAVFKKAG